jgi:uncharacterized protein (UPF0332 family)
VTEDNRKQAIAQDLRQSELAMKGARLLKDAGLYNDALSRLYYALHHATLALLMTESIEPRRHRAVSSLLSTHFLSSGKLAAEDIAPREPQGARLSSAPGSGNRLSIHARAGLG